MPYKKNTKLEKTFSVIVHRQFIQEMKSIRVEPGTCRHLDIFSTLLLRIHRGDHTLFTDNLKRERIGFISHGLLKPDVCTLIAN